MDGKIMTEVNKKFVIDTNLDMVSFISVVNEIAAEYFDADGTYTPHIGWMNAMRVFYNECVKESPYSTTLPFPITDAIEMKELVNDEDFMHEFEAAIWETCNLRFDFSTAYFMAKDIVDNKRTSFATILEIVQNIAVKFAEKLNESVSDERMDKIGLLAKKLTEENTDVKSIIETLVEVDKLKK